MAASALAGGPGFISQRILIDQYEKHGREFGNIKMPTYLQLAQQLRDSKPGRNILEARRPGGGGAKFDRKYGYFVLYEGDGAIRMFFIPAEGVRYFDRQAHVWQDMAARR